MKMKTHIPKLLSELERTAGRKIQTPRDFEWLCNSIYEKTRELVSMSTLKRVWGYTTCVGNQRVATLDILSRYVGYKDWNSFCQQIEESRKAPQSYPALADKIESKDLEIGDRLRVIWDPDRVCVFRHEGEGRFVVESSENSKLCAGDTFTCHLFIKGEALYLTELRTSKSPDMSQKYVCGRSSGVIVTRL